MIRYISDLHFFHKNINDRLDKRGFKDVFEMNEYMIAQWNSVVNDNDTVIILGDFSLGNGKQTNEVLKKLKGNKCLIEGNHDYKFLNDPDFDISLIKYIGYYSEKYDGEYRVILSHYPILFYNGQYKKNKNGNPSTYMLYGHIHNTQDMDCMRKINDMFDDYSFTREKDGSSEVCKIPHNMINCFCMFSDYKPLTLKEWINIYKDYM